MDAQRFDRITRAFGTRLSRRLVISASAGLGSLALAGTSNVSANAQDATPAVPSPVAGSSLLANLGFPDLVIITDGTAFAPPADIAAGRYHLVVQNTGTSALNLQLYQPPEDATMEETIDIFEGADGAEEIPELFYRLGINGGAHAEPRATGDVILDITPGEWFFGLEVLAPEDGSRTASLGAVVSATGAMPATDEPPADVAVTFIDLAFEMPDNVPAGPHVWKLTNAGAIPHFLDIESYPEPVTQDQVHATLDTFFGTPPTTPAPTIDPGLLRPQFESMVLSSGSSNWVVVDLDVGQQLGFCFIPGPGDLPVHALMGMFKILTAA